MSMENIKIWYIIYLPKSNMMFIYIILNDFFPFLNYVPILTYFVKVKHDIFLVQI